MIAAAAYARASEPSIAIMLHPCSSTTQMLERFSSISSFSCTQGLLLELDRKAV